jgi:hypothetical protein
VTDIEERRLRFQVDVTLSSGAEKTVKRLDDRRLMLAYAVMSILSGTLALDFGAPVFLGLPSLSLLMFVGAMIVIVLLIFGYPR